ncbi:MULTISPECIES: DUF4199 domain-containing protein [unclassified Flavobacterium]|uniref:DUF4199 domain-containing protein n=1 Tax=unclassified Flavobacterium TaxID=196869 RepID=UPI000EB016E3|nr:MULTISPECIES: DUF4199 domain-containing protein [unclassified Flavobacterium]RKS02275.1 uncharacterized protein DUF4199 [Flavobacterium sp. 102]
MKNYSIEIKWTLRFILLVLAWAIGEKFTGLHDQHIDQYALYTNLFAIPALLFYYLALKEKKKYVYNNNITWSQGFASGVVLSFFIALLMPIAQFVIYKSISPHFFETIIEYKTKSPLLSRHVTLKDAQSYFNLKSYMIQGVFSGLSMGIITGALVSLLLRNKK